MLCTQTMVCCGRVGKGSTLLQCTCTVTSNVQSVHWSCSLQDECCFMAVVHHDMVTVWRVSGAVPRLAFKQVRKINVQPVPQGCLWNPKNDVLCLLSRQQCSFYFRHAHNRGSFAFPSLEHEKISCGCWASDGKRLVICVGAALLIYTWSDVETNINDFVTAAWRIPGVSGSITAIVPGSNDSVVCASDLPLEALCKNNTMDTFAMPEAGRKPTGSNGILKPSEGKSVKDGLLNLEPSQKSPVQDSAMLTVVRMKPGPQDPTILTSAQVPGLLSPDLLHFQDSSQCVVVGSNTQSVLQVFALLDNHLLPAGHLMVDKDERPKGVCSLDTTQLSNADGVLVLIGTTAPSDSLFPSANNTSSYALSLKFFPIRPEKAHQLLNGHMVAVRTPSSSSLTKSESLRETRSPHLKDKYRHARQASYKGERPDHRFRSPDRGMSGESRIKLSLADISCGEAHPRLVEEITDSPRSIVEEVDGEEERTSPGESLTVERVDFSAISPHFDNSKLSQQFEINSVTTHNGTLHHSSASKPVSGQTSPKSESINSVASEQSPGQLAANDRILCSTPAKPTSSQPPMNIQTPNSKWHSEQSSNGVGTRGLVESPVVNGGVKKTEKTVRTGVKAQQRSAAVVQCSGVSRQDTPSPQLLNAVQRSGVSRQDTPSPQLLNAVSVQGKKAPVDDDASVCSSLGSSYETLEKQIQAQNDNIAALQKRLEQLAAMVEGSTCVLPSKYQEMTEPEVVSIQCVVGGAHVTRKFLLDSGRLQLEPVRQAFGLSSVELILDGEALVLGANVDGYIPMRFTAGSFLQVTGIPILYSSPHLPQKTRSKDPVKPL
ncbi:uncharacterized protein LOC143297799 isoform X2 [Babylonia areolata]|uniref:uncharacterized protein LOC143297799 isoform X2 n=1 Tax=Babylonia areolata TaxID=304850 RepID=UPI003FD1AC1C